MTSLLRRSLFAAQDGLTRVMYGAETPAAASSFYDCVDKDIKGETVSMSQFKGQVFSQGFKILAFPCNQFGGQEPGSPEQILDFVKQFDENMSDKLVFFEKADVNGGSAREVFKVMKAEATNDDGTLDIRWNFCKFLIDREGNVVRRFQTTDAPDSIKPHIEELLKKKAGASS